MASYNDAIFLAAIVFAVFAIVTLKIFADLKRKSNLERAMLQSGLLEAPYSNSAIYRASVGASGRFLVGHIKMPGSKGEPWSADDEDHAWRVGVAHAFSREPFNPPREAQYRDAYLDGYRSTSEDEGIPNEYPDS
jgi:hypothetical protein